MRETVEDETGLAIGQRFGVSESEECHRAPTGLENLDGLKDVGDLSKNREVEPTGVS